MGIFSFLTGRSATPGDRVRDAEPPAPAAPVEPAATPETARPEMPAAWDFGALHSPPPTTPPDGVEVGPADAALEAEIAPRVVAALSTIFDPEIPVNIYDLGLVYRCDVDEKGAVEVDMTLTAPGCPVAQTFPDVVEAAVRRVPGVTDVLVDVVWDPPWTLDRMTDEAKLQLGLL